MYDANLCKIGFNRLDASDWSIHISCKMNILLDHGIFPTNILKSYIFVVKTLYFFSILSYHCEKVKRVLNVQAELANRQYCDKLVLVWSVAQTAPINCQFHALHPNYARLYRRYRLLPYPHPFIDTFVLFLLLCFFVQNHRQSLQFKGTCCCSKNKMNIFN